MFFFIIYIFYNKISASPSTSRVFNLFRISRLLLFNIVDKAIIMAPFSSLAGIKWSSVYRLVFSQVIFSLWTLLVKRGISFRKCRGPNPFDGKNLRFFFEKKHLLMGSNISDFKPIVILLLVIKYAYGCSLSRALCSPL